MVKISTNVDFELTQGTTKYIECKLFYEDMTTPILNTEISEMTFGVKRYGQGLSSTILITKKLTLGEISYTAPGTYLIKLLPADTNNLIGKMQYELRVKETIILGSDEFVALSGLFVVNARSTI